MSVLRLSLVLAGMIFGIWSAAPVALADSTISVTQDNGMNRPLGNGYDSRKEALRAQCVEGKASSEVEEGGTVSQGDIKLRVEADQGSVADKLGFAVGGRARIGVVNYRASAEYYTESLSTGLSLSYVYSADFLYNAYLVNSAAHPVTLRPGMDGFLKDAARWHETCGDEFTFMHDKGARLFLTLRLDFVSREERSRFAAQFGAEGPLFKVDGSFETANAKYSRNTQLTITGLQIGGDPAKLGSAFCPPQSESGEPNPNCLKDAKKTISCSFGELGDCMTVMSQLVAYGNGQDASSFGGQIKDFKNYSVLKLHSQPWIYLGSKYPLPPKQEEIQNYETNLQLLKDIFEDNYRNWAASYRYWRGKAPRLSGGELGQRDRMGLLQAQFKENMSATAEAIRACYERPMSCDSAVRTVKSRIQYGTPDYSTEKNINELLVPETYAQYCDLMGSNDHLKRTIQALDQLAFEKSGETSQEAWRKGDACFRAEEVLSRLESIDLVGKELVDLRPIATLTQLRRLNLSQNRISDVTQLTNLRMLEDLRLDDNLVNDLRPIARISTLQKLSLQNNRMEDLKPLASIPNLKFLDLRRNGEDIECPLRDASICRTSDFASLSSFIQLSRDGGVYEARVGQTAIGLQNGNVLITGGVNAAGNILNTVEVFNADSLSFQIGRAMHYARIQHTVSPLPDGCRYLIAGGGEFSKTFEVYDLCLNQGGVGTLKIPRTGHTATVLNDGRVLLVGGWTDGTIPQDFRLGATATAEIFDPATGTTQLTGSMHVPRALHSALLLSDGRVLVSGGYLENRGLSTLEVYDPITGSFEMLQASMSKGRSGHSMTALKDGTILIAGGYSTDNAAVPSAEILNPSDPTDPQRMRIVEQLSMDTPRGAHSAVALSNGKVLILGGSSSYSGGISNKFDQNGKSEATVELFDPVTRSFSPLNPMKKARSYPVAIPIPKSRVLIMGGMGSEASALTAELFEYVRMK